MERTSLVRKHCAKGSKALPFAVGRVQFTNTYIQTNTHARVHTHTHPHTHTRTHAHTGARAHTHTHTLKLLTPAKLLRFDSGGRQHKQTVSGNRNKRFDSGGRQHKQTVSGNRNKRKQKRSR